MGVFCGFAIGIIYLFFDRIRVCFDEGSFLDDDVLLGGRFIMIECLYFKFGCGCCRIVCL